MSKPIDILYICDKKACENCHEEDCMHTSNLEHAIHKDCMNGRIFKYVNAGNRIGFFEVEDKDGE